MPGMMSSQVARPLALPPPGRGRRRLEARGAPLPSGRRGCWRSSRGGDHRRRGRPACRGPRSGGRRPARSRSRCRCRTGASRPRTAPRPAATGGCRRSARRARSRNGPPRPRCRRCRRSGACRRPSGCRGSAPGGIDGRPDLRQGLEGADRVGERLLERHRPSKWPADLPATEFSTFWIDSQHPPGPDPMLLRKLTLSHFRNVPLASLAFERDPAVLRREQRPGQVQPPRGGGLPDGAALLRTPDSRNLIMHERRRQGIACAVEREGSASELVPIKIRRDGKELWYGREAGDPAGRPRRAFPDGRVLLPGPAADPRSARAAAPLARPHPVRHGPEYLGRSRPTRGRSPGGTASCAGGSSDAEGTDGLRPHPGPAGAADRGAAAARRGGARRGDGRRLRGA
jgi:hypothetical protein